MHTTRALGGGDPYIALTLILHLLIKRNDTQVFFPRGGPSAAPGGRWSLRPLGRETHGAHSAALRPVCLVPGGVR